MGSGPQVGLLVLAIIASLAITSQAIVRPPTPSLIDCLCYVDSGCVNRECISYEHSVYGTTKEICGFFNIDADYWDNCGQPMGSWEACARDYRCARSCVLSYLGDFINWCTEYPQPEDYAKLHYSGEEDCTVPSADSYWSLVDQCMNNKILEIPIH